MVVARFVRNVAYRPSAGRAWVVTSTTRAPVSFEMAWATAGDVPSSVKIAGTPAARIVSASVASSAADGAAAVVTLGTSAPINRRP